MASSRGDLTVTKTNNQNKTMNSELILKNRRGKTILVPLEEFMAPKLKIGSRSKHKVRVINGVFGETTTTFNIQRVQEEWPTAHKLIWSVTDPLSGAIHTTIINL